ncbi:uncharacterized protein AB9W97_009640 [Spinachia spinachia]
MKMILLLVSSALLLAASALPLNDMNSLNHIIDLTKQYNESLHMGHFVEDVNEVAGNCTTDYPYHFCKVHDILRQHRHFGKPNEAAEVRIVKNLNIFTAKLNPTCAVLLKNRKTSNDSIPIPRLIDDLVKCIRTVNMST